MPRITEIERKKFHSILDSAIDKMNRPKNANKEHWSMIPVYKLFKLLDIEVKELDLEVAFGCTHNTLEECYDVINIAMMIAYNTESFKNDS